MITVRTGAYSMKPASLHRRILFPLLLCGGLLFALLFWYFSPFFSPGENRRFSAYVEERFHSEVTSSAITLHYTLADPASRGIAPGTASFGTVSIPDRTSYDALLQSVETTLTSFHRNRLSAENQITLDLLLYELDCEKMPGSTSLLAELLGPSLGIQAQLPILLAEYPFRTQQDIADYLHLLQDLPRYFSDLIALEQEKSRQGVFQNDLAVDGIIRQCSAFLADADTPESHLLHTVFQNKLQASSLFSEAERNLCLQTHEKLLTSCVFPAYRSLSDALSSLRGKGTQNAGGLSRQEGGLSYYAYLLRSRVGVDASPEELTRLLTQQLADQCAEMQIILDQNPSLPLSEQALVLPFSTPEEMLADLQNAVSEDFPVLSGIAYEVKTVDDSLKDFLSPAFYLTPPADVNSPNSIYLNPADEMTGIELYSTLAHEGFPGHLYQTVSFSRSDPLLIRRLYAPSGYVEGWATYVESYACRYAARNLDANTQALCRLWYLNRSVHLTLCSLLDLGIHSQGWLLSDASAFLAQFGITDASAAASLYQYILETPAIYLKYCVGSLSFSQLLSEVREQEGGSFSLIGFHEKLLRLGPLPFPLVEKYL